MNILVLETSTTSAKALIYNTNTQTYQVESKAFDKSNPDVTIHNPKVVYNKTIEVAYTLLKRMNFKDKIDVVSIVTTWHSLILADEDLESFTNCFLWSNQIGQAYLDSPLNPKDFYRITGCVNSSMYPYFKLLKLKDDHLLNEKTLIVDQGSYNYYQLTNKLLTSREMASGSGLYNSKELCYDQKILKILGINEKQLPTLYKGEKYKYSSKDCKLLDKYMRKDTIVLPAMPDGAMNQLGSVGNELNKMTISVGTSGALRVLNKKHVYSANKSTWSYSLGGQALVGAATSGACNCIEDVKNHLFKDLTYEEIELLLEAQEIGLTTTNPIFLPFTYGERSPGFVNNRRSGFVGNKANELSMYTSALEGVLFNLYQCYIEIVQLVGKPKEIHLSGGILNSAFWMQMCCDIFGETIIIDKILHSSLYGGVVYSCKELDLDCHNLFTSEHKSMTPNKNLSDYYKQRFSLYLAAYKHQT